MDVARTMSFLPQDLGLGKAFQHHASNFHLPCCDLKKTQNKDDHTQKIAESNTLEN